MTKSEPMTPTQVIIQQNLSNSKNQDNSSPGTVTSNNPISPDKTNKIDQASKIPVDLLYKEVEVENIVVRPWYTQKFVSQGERDFAERVIRGKSLGCANIRLRYDAASRQYQLIDGLPALQVYRLLGTKKIRAEVVNGDQISESEALKTSIGYHNRTPSNKWESTVSVLKYLEMTLNIRDQDRYIIKYDHATATKSKKARNTQEIIISKLKSIETFVALEKLEGKDRDERRLKAVSANFTAEDKMHVDSVLAAAQVGLSHFIKSRLLLLNLPKAIIEKLKSGEINYRKAINISKIGIPEEFRIFSEYLSDINIHVEIAKEQQKLLDETIENNLSVDQIKELVKEAHGRLQPHCSILDDKTLADSELAEKVAIRNDIKQQNNCGKGMNYVVKKLSKWSFWNELDDREKSNWQTAIKNLVDKMERAEKSVEERKKAKKEEERLAKKAEKEAEKEAEKSKSMAKV